MTTNQQEYVGDAEMLLKKSDIEFTADLVFTEENVEKILDELRPYLINDGGNVSLKELDGPIVKV